MQKTYPFRPLKKTRLYEEVTEQIKQSIFNGQLKPGDRLPPERELCEIFNVGRPTIREALRTLGIMGLVHVNTGKSGSFVKEWDINRYMEAFREQLSWLMKVEAKTIADLWEVRKYLELGIAHSAAHNATPADFKRLGDLVKKMEACGDDIQAYFPIGMEFHHELALATKNKIFFLVWEMVQDIIMKGYAPFLNEIFPEGPDKLIEANKVMLKAIKRRDPEAINKAMEIHAKADNKDFYLQKNHLSDR